MNDIKSKLTEITKNLSDKDKKFYQLDKLNIILEKTIQFKDNCNICEEQLNKIDKILNELNNKKFNNNVQLIDKETSAIIKHMRKIHKLYLPRYFNYTYTFAGMFAGALMGVIAGFAFFPDYKWAVILIFWIFGTVNGRIIGNIKDQQIKKNKQSFNI